MSSNHPPAGPPSGPPSGPPAGPPSGPPFGPPSGPPAGGPPPSGPPEYLHPSGGAPVPPSGSGSKSGGRKAAVAGGAVVGLAAVAVGGYFAWGAFFGSGVQASAGLPASTLGFVSFDLDPSGEQKVEALETLEKFPGFSQAADQEGIEPDTDLRQTLFEQVQEDEGVCTDLSFEDDIEPWLGTTFGFAAVQLDGESEDGGPNVAPVGVVEISDAGAAEDGIAALRDCASAGGEEGTGGYAIEGDWAIVAETQEQADEVVEAARENPLSDDEDFQRWMDAVGDPGIMTGYASPAAGPLLAELAEFAPLAAGVATPMAIEPGSTDLGAPGDSPAPEPDPATQQLTELLESFDGAAMSVRFADGGLEVETASSVDFLGLEGLSSSDRGDDVVATLPENTAVALGVGFEEGWFDDIVAYADQMSGGMVDVEEGLSFLEAQTGLSLPEDAETLFGESAALALRADFDPAAVETDPSALPLGLKIKGDTGGITGVIDSLTGGLPPEVGSFVNVQDDGEFVAVGTSEEYASQLLEDGGLGDTDAYQDVVRESGDAASVLFVNFDADDWLTRVTAGLPEVQENVEPLEALGLSSWTDDDGTSHSVLRVTTGD